MSESARFGAVLQLQALEGKRDELVHVLANYSRTLDGELGTTLFAAAADAADDDIVWVWAEFNDEDAVRRPFRPRFLPRASARARRPVASTGRNPPAGSVHPANQPRCIAGRVSAHWTDINCTHPG